MTFAPLRSISHPVRPFALAAACALALLPAWASAQSLRELYDAARAYDATYLAARALADSAQYRAAQADALNRPNVGLVANASRTDVEVPPTVTGPGRTADPPDERPLLQQPRRCHGQRHPAAVQPRQRRHHRAGAARARGGAWPISRRPSRT